MASRKRKSLSLNDKMKILKQVDDNLHLTKVDLAKKLGMPVSTLTTLIYKRKTIEENAIASGSSASKKLRVQSGKFADVEDLLLQFFNQCRSSNLPVSGQMLMEKAKEISQKLNVDCNSSFSTGWLHKFKKRHGISGKSVSGESGEVNSETVDDWKQNVLPELISGYEPKNIFNADETGLFFNLLPSKTLAMKNDPCHGGKKSKARLTVLLCVNSDGSEKLPPYVIGRSQKPRCFKNVKTLPTQYTANKKAWVTTQIFIEWLKALDKKMSEQKRHILLFVDRCPAHPPNTDFLQNVDVKFLPANCTSKLQPLDLGIIKNMKDYYRKHLVRLAVECLGKSSLENLKIDVLQAMNFVAMAWQQVSPLTIEKCFAHAGFGSKEADIDLLEENTESIISPEIWSTLSDLATFEEYAGCDSELATSSLLTIDELIEIKENENCSSSEDDDENAITPPAPNFTQALAAFDVMKAFLISHNINENTQHALSTIYNELFALHSGNSYQATLTKYFTVSNEK